MAYRIVYDQIHRPKNSNLRLSVLTGLFFLIFCYILRTLWPEGCTIVRDCILPWDSAAAAAALNEFTDNLNSGFSFIESFRIFGVHAANIS